MKIRRLLLWIALSISCFSQIAAATQTDRDSLYRHISHEMSAELSCRFTYGQGSNAISSNLGANAAELNKLDEFIRQALSHPTLFISRIRLTGYSSIEGTYATNEALSRERAQHFHSYLRVRYPELHRYPLNIAWVAEDWQGLSRLVRESSINEREEILEIIRKVPGFDERERLLAYLNGGHAYGIMERTMFPRLRRVEMEIEYATQPTAPQSTAQIASPQPSPTERDQEPSGIETSERHVAAPSFGEGRGEAVSSPLEPLFAIKTNLLLWSGIQSDFKHTTPVANVALEYYINTCFSIEVGAMYSYWRYHSNQEFQGISGYRFEPRYRLTSPGGRFGAYLGTYVRFGDYDLRKALTVNSQLSTVNSNPVGRTGDYWDAGLSTGVTINLVGSLGLEIGGRVGYVHTNTIKYNMDNQFNWFESKSRYNKVRVTDLNVSLIYRFR